MRVEWDTQQTTLKATARVGNSRHLVSRRANQRVRREIETRAAFNVSVDAVTGDSLFENSNLALVDERACRVIGQADQFSGELASLKPPAQITHINGCCIFGTDEPADQRNHRALAVRACVVDHHRHLSSVAAAVHGTAKQLFNLLARVRVVARHSV